MANFCAIEFRIVFNALREYEAFIDWFNVGYNEYAEYISFGDLLHVWLFVSRLKFDKANLTIKFTFGERWTHSVENTIAILRDLDFKQIDVLYAESGMSFLGKGVYTKLRSGNVTYERSYAIYEVMKLVEGYGKGIKKSFS